jgi:hypothetical protein
MITGLRVSTIIITIIIKYISTVIKLSRIVFFSTYLFFIYFYKHVIRTTVEKEIPNSDYYLFKIFIIDILCGIIVWCSIEQ